MILDLQNINRSYGEGKLEVPVLFDIDLQVEAGEYVAIMGPSGSGKSTLMNIIGCLDVPTSGTYILEHAPHLLSGGQKQRVAIARAMVMKPSLLLADEPTGALDTASGEQVMELFRQLNEEGVTIVMITHEQEIANHAHRQLMIRDGRLSDHKGGAPV